MRNEQQSQTERQDDSSLRDTTAPGAVEPRFTTPSEKSSTDKSDAEHSVTFVCPARNVGRLTR